MLVETILTLKEEEELVMQAAERDDSSD